jgi:hypothetical protein
MKWLKCLTCDNQSRIRESVRFSLRSLKRDLGQVSGLEKRLAWRADFGVVSLVA